MQLCKILLSLIVVFPLEIAPNAWFLCLIV